MTREEAERLFLEGEQYARTSPWTTRRLLCSKTVWLISISYGIIVLIVLAMIGMVLLGRMDDTCVGRVTLDEEK